MSRIGFLGTEPQLATTPSCMFYLRGGVHGETNLRDWSPYKRTVTNIGITSSSTVTPRLPQGSLYLNGSSAATFPYSSELTVNTNDCLVGFWWYPTSTATQYLMYFGAAGDATNRWGLLFYNQHLTLVNSGSLYGESTTSVTQNAWNHIMFYKKSGHVYFYNKGVQKSDDTLAALMVPSTTVTFGRYGYDSTYYTNGYFDEVVMFVPSITKTIPTPTQLWELAQRRRLIL